MKGSNKLIIAGIFSMGILGYLRHRNNKRSNVQVTVVQPFEIVKYMGKWFEIARLDFHWERNLSNTSAEYDLLPDGKVQVINRGWNEVENRWEESTGKAKQIQANRGALKVSFFGPFYSDYNVIALHEYKYALVAGKDENYLWILSREKTIPEHIKLSFLATAMEFGYNIENLIWPVHDID